MPAYRAFNDIFHRKLRFIGQCLGLDVLQPHFRINFITVFTIFCAISVPLLYFITSLYEEGDLAMTASMCIRVGFKVSNIAVSLALRVSLELL